MESSPASTSYTVLARRYRPQGFDEVIGQEHIAQSLRNAILAGRVAHAYLFTGARGVGKTSTARILAKALNCPNAVDATPCNHCEICDNTAAGRDVDVLEIDGASNRGIDDIRQLRANVNVKSMRSKYKIYIIDEVHMLTKEAFNALLKTLEEPPPNVKFVFCTTEPNKVPDTILSRCQRFDFGTIELAKIIERLASIALAEKKEVAPAALELVARRAAGSMRDSQSLFDQLLASSETHISAADVHRLLGTASDERLMELFNSIIARQRGQTLTQLSQALADGAQLGELADQILNYLRDLMVLAAEAVNVPLLSVSETNRTALQKQAAAWGLNTVVAALQIVSEAKLKMQRATFGRALVELALIRLTLLEQLQALDALLNELSSTPTSRTMTVTSVPTAVLPAQTTATPDLEKKKPEPVDSLNKPIETAASEEIVPASSPVAERLPSQSLASRIATEGQNVEKPDAVVEQSATSLPAVSEKQRLDLPQSSTDFCPGSESSFWPQVLADVGDDVGAQLKRACRVAICGPNRLEIVFPKSYLFAKSLVEKPEARERLVSVIERVVGQQVQVAFGVSEDFEVPKSASSEPAKSARRMDNSTNGDPFVERVIELFNAKVMKKESVSQPIGPDSA